MIIVHHLNNSRSQRVLWLLEELGLEYNIKFYVRDPETMLAPASLRKIHPLGKSPVITDGEKVIAESGAIMEYLMTRTSKLIAKDHLRFVYWLHYAEGSLMTPLLLKLVFSRLSQKPVPVLIRPIAAAIAMGVNKSYIDPQIKLHVDYLESELSKTKWFAGDDFSAADIQMSFPIEALESRSDLKSHPHLVKYLELIRVRPAYQRALQKGGPFTI
jgi:glutathione S-transferase